MTHMDDQIAKHIREMILKATRKPVDYHKHATKRDPLNQIVRTLRRGVDYPCDLIPLIRSSWPDEGPKI
jgi:hypothetical protein